MSRPKFLVIEDNPADIELLRFALDKQGEPYDLDILMDGEQALQFIEEHRAGTRALDPCVILLDVHLPRFDGLQILKALKQAPALTHIRVIMLTSFASIEEEAQIASLGAVYRTKPAGLRQYMDLGEEIFEVCKTMVFA
jgi:CheY-like chemotaxis protein